MKSLLFTLITLLLPVLLTAQNYQSISGSDKYFARTTQYAEHDNIIALHIDSVQTAQNGDVYYFPYRIMRDTSNNWEGCIMDTAAPSFAGKQITVKTNGENVFLNQYNKELILKTAANLDEEWDFAVLNDVKFKAKVTNISQQTITGITDSIKTIELQAFDLSGNPIQDPMNGKELKLSKNNGLLSVLNFYEFPYDTAAYHYVDYQPLTWGDIYDFNIGDYFIYYLNALYYAMPPQYEITEILGKQISITNDSITYTAKITYVNNTLESDPEPHIVSTVHDTIKEITYTSLNQLVGANLPHQHNNQRCISFHNTLSNQSCCSNNDLFTILLDYSRPYDCDLSTGCYVPAFEGMEGYAAYTQGLGKTKEYYIDWSGFNGWDHYLQYYRKGSITWGDPSVLNILFPEKVQQVIVTPNPAENEIKLMINNTLSGQINIGIFAANGQKEKVIALNAMPHDTFIPLNISDLKSGLHFLVINAEDKTLSAKFIKN